MKGKLATLKLELKELMGESDLLNFFLRIEENILTNIPKYSDYIALKQQYNYNKKEKKSNTVSDEHSTLTQNQVVNGLLYFVENLEKEDLKQNQGFNIPIATVKDSTNTPLDKPTILIIDDDNDFHEKLSSALRSNFLFISAYSREIGLEKLKEKTKIDLIVLDLIFDESTKYLDGLGTATDISKMYPSIPIIIITADSRIAKSQSIGSFMQSAGVDDILSKAHVNLKDWKDRFWRSINRNK